MAGGGGGGGGNSPTYTVGLGSSRPNLGTLVSAGSGTTNFTETPGGTVTVSSGGGGFDPPAASRSVTPQTITISCTNSGGCQNANVEITVTAAGASGRMSGITNFVASMGSAQYKSGNLSGPSLDFIIKPISQNTSKTFTLGMTIPVTASGTAGSASASYSISASASGANTGTGGASAVATIYRGISISKNADLEFGKIVQPTGNATVALNAISNTRLVSGTVGLNSPTPGAAAFTVTGEGGQAISVSISASSLTGPGSSMALTTNTTAVGSINLSSGLGSPGSYSFTVGGTFTVPAYQTHGTYSGTVAATVNYN